jgi:hypothetical protein
MIAYFAGDLVWATRIKSAAEDLRISARPVRTLEMLNARLQDSLVRGLIVELSGDEIAFMLMNRAREWEREGASGETPPRRIRVVAFGPHVETEWLARAKSAGADLILARGAFSTRLNELLKELDSPPA